MKICFNPIKHQTHKIKERIAASYISIDKLGKQKFLIFFHFNNYFINQFFIYIYQQQQNHNPLFF